MDTLSFPYPVTARVHGRPAPIPLRQGDPAIDLLEQWAGVTFANGLYRVHNDASARTIRPALELAFPARMEGSEPFGFDWLGRQFVASGSSRTPLVLMLEPGTGQALEIPVSVWDFHVHELVHEPDAALAAAFFTQWLQRGGRPLGHGEAVGYRTPLFLGGQDDISNLEIVDIDVYWSIASQLLAKTQSLPPGSRVDPRIE